MSQKVCPECKTPNVSDGLFCFNCGARLDPPSQKELVAIIFQRSSKILTPIYMIFLILVGMSGILLSGYYLMRTIRPEVELGLPWQDDEITDSSFRSSEKSDLDDINRVYLTSIERWQEYSSVPIERIVRNADRYNREKVVFEGEIIKLDTFSYAGDVTLGSIENIDEEDGSEYFSEEAEDRSLYFAGLVVADETGSSVLVVFRGSDEYFELEDYVEVTGIVNEEPTGVVATKIEMADKADPIVNRMEDNIFYFTLATMVWMVLSIILFLTRAGNRRKRIGQLATAILITTLLAGCEIHFVTEIKPDGSGTMSTTFIESAENVDFLRQVPLTLDMFEAWKIQARQSGIITDNFVQGDMETIYIQRSVEDFEKLSSEDEIDGHSQWIFFDRTSYEDGESYRFEGFIDTSILLEIDSDLGSRVVNEMQKEIKEIQIDYSLILPGEIVYHNADSEEGNKLSWDIPIEEGRYIIAESEVQKHDAQTGFFTMPDQIFVILLAIFVLFTLLIFVSAIFYRKKLG